MHYDTRFGVASGEIRNYLAEGIREEAFVEVADCCVNIFFSGAHSPLGIFHLVGHRVSPSLLLEYDLFLFLVNGEFAKLLQD
jgi:hypothetical protein